MKTTQEKFIASIYPSLVPSFWMMCHPFLIEGNLPHKTQQVLRQYRLTSWLNGTQTDYSTAFYCSDLHLIKSMLHWRDKTRFSHVINEHIDKSSTDDFGVGIYIQTRHLS